MQEEMGLEGDERCRNWERNKRVHGESVFGNHWRLTIFLRAGYLQVSGCVRVISERATSEKTKYRQKYGTNTQGQRSGEHSRRVW